MQRFITILAFIAFSFSAGSFAAAKSKASPKPSALPTAAPAAMATTCPAGETAVKGYTKKNGTTVKAYCRKAPSSTSKSSPKPKAT
jgi:hypothetical protein